MCRSPDRPFIPQPVFRHRGGLQGIPGQLQPRDGGGERLQTEGGALERDRQSHQDLSVGFNRLFKPKLKNQPG